MDINKLLEEAQKMQQDLTAISDEIDATIYEGNNGGEHGVTVKMNGKYETQEVIIADELLNVEDKEMLQDMILIASNAAVEKINADREEKLGAATAGLNFPGM